MTTINITSTQLKNILTPGMRLIIREEEWIIDKVETNNLNLTTIYCHGVSGLVKNIKTMFLTDMEKIDLVDPAKVKLVPDDTTNFNRSRLFIESQLRQRVPTDTCIHIGQQAGQALEHFLLVPAQMALSRPRPRILIADTVDIARIIEVGVLISELILRGKGKKILVVTETNLMTQFQNELWNRFTIPLVLLDSTKIYQIKSSLPINQNPFFYYDKAVISIDTLKADANFLSHLEKNWWNIIVLATDQYMVDPEVQHLRSRLANLLANRSDSLIILSSTPHLGGAKSFSSLINMLDPSAIADPIHFQKEDLSDLCVRRFKKDFSCKLTGPIRTVQNVNFQASKEEENV
jgi:SNF2 family DNA or RNA helicase